MNLLELQLISGEKIWIRPDQIQAVVDEGQGGKLKLRVGGEYLYIKYDREEVPKLIKQLREG